MFILPANYQEDKNTAYMTFNKSYSIQKSNMKHLKLFTAIIFSACLLLAYSSNNSSSGGKETDPPSATTTSAGNASWSWVIDGQQVSGGQVSSFQGPEGYHGKEGHIVDVDQGKELLFYLSDTKNATGRHLLY